MSWDVAYVPEHDTLVLTHTGVVSVRDAREQARLIICLLKETKATRLLVDYSESTIEIPASEIFTLPGYYSSLGAPRNRRVAHVVPKARDQVHAVVYHQIVARGRGYDFALFSRRDLAMAWLREGREDEGGRHCSAFPPIPPPVPSPPGANSGEALPPSA